MGYVLGLFILILDIAAIVHCLRGNLMPEKKALWIVLIVMLPVAGLILYRIFAYEQS